MFPKGYNCFNPQLLVVFVPFLGIAILHATAMCTIAPDDTHVYQSSKQAIIPTQLIISDQKAKLCMYNKYIFEQKKPK